MLQHNGVHDDDDSGLLSEQDTVNSLNDGNRTRQSGRG